MLLGRNPPHLCNRLRLVVLLKGLVDAVVNEFRFSLLSSLDLWQAVNQLSGWYFWLLFSQGHRSSLQQCALIERVDCFQLLSSALVLEILFQIEVETVLVGNLRKVNDLSLPSFDFGSIVFKGLDEVPRVLLLEVAGLGWVWKPLQTPLFRRFSAFSYDSVVHVVLALVGGIDCRVCQERQSLLLLFLIWWSNWKRAQNLRIGKIWQLFQSHLLFQEGFEFVGSLAKSLFILKVHWHFSVPCRRVLNILGKTQGLLCRGSILLSVILLQGLHGQKRGLFRSGIVFLGVLARATWIVDGGFV